MSATGSVYAGAGQGQVVTLPPTASPGRTARVVRVADVAPERIGWLWPAYIPVGKLTVIDGDPGAGKSTLSLDLAARVSSGGAMPDGSPVGERGSVLILSAEDGIADTIRPRLGAAAADLTRCFVLDEINDEGQARPVELPTDLDAIATLIQKHSIRLVTIDPLMAFLGGGIDSHRDQDVRRVLMPMSKLAEATGAAFLVVRHMNKSGGGKALYRGGGSIGITGAARAAYVVGPDPDDDERRVLACAKMNIGPHPPGLAYRVLTDDELDCSRISWEGTVRHRADDLMAHVDDDERGERDEAVDFLLDLLAAGPVAAVDVKTKAKAAGIAAITLKRAKKQLNVESRKGGFSAGWEWLLPEGAHSTAKGLTPKGEPLGHDMSPLDDHAAAVALLQRELGATPIEGDAA